MKRVKTTSKRLVEYLMENDIDCTPVEKRITGKENIGELVRNMDDEYLLDLFPETLMAIKRYLGLPEDAGLNIFDTGSMKEDEYPIRSFDESYKIRIKRN